MQQAPALLGASMRLVSRDRPFETIAIVLLPDHLHCLWNLPRGDEDFSTRWRAIKAHFTRSWLAWTGLEASTTPSQVRRGYRGVWQSRFWEHLIRDEDDLERHFDYIHFNPVRHGVAGHPADWPWSSFHRHVRNGHYPREWGAHAPETARGLSCE